MIPEDVPVASIDSYISNGKGGPRQQGRRYAKDLARRPRKN